MPQPSQQSVHVDRPLTIISVAYMQDQRNFVAPQVFPWVPVDKQTDLYFSYTKNDWFRDEAQLRGDNEESAGSGYNLTTSQYRCRVWAFHKDIGAQTRANADSPLDMDRDATQFVTRRLLLRQEIQWATDFFTTNVWGNDVTPTNLWNDYTNSDPISDVETGKDAILGVTGYEANTLVVGYQVWKFLRNHPDLVDRYKYTTSSTLTEEMVARLFGLERVLVSKGIKATNAEGLTAAYAYIAGKNALLCYAAPQPALLQPSAGYTFSWRGVSEGMGYNIGVKSIPMPLKANATRIEGEIALGNQVIGSDLGYFFSNVVS